MSDRKYRQRGYQDDDGGADRPRPSGPRPSGPRPEREGPRGRGLGRPTESVFRCAVCGHPQQAGFGFEATCGKCGADLHTCTHCVSFDTGAAGECRQSGIPYVASKAKRNRCESFEPRTTQEFKKEAETPSAGKAAFDALFNF